MNPPDFSFEKAMMPGPVCGIDEAGRGPWAGPVVAAAVILPAGCAISGIDDSKKLTKLRRERLCREIVAVADVGLGDASVKEIDELNILAASHLAMCRAVAALPRAPAFALVDGNRLPPGLPCPARAIVKGDARSASIAAASIVAKVARDRIMAELAARFPGYGWESNAGYGVPAHRDALHRLGVTPHHRRSFRPIHNMLCEEQ
ncbi:MAG: ribonuclease HII [Paracoccaceae bacterium]